MRSTSHSYAKPLEARVPCRSRPRARFRREAGRRHRHAGHRPQAGRQADHPRRQGAGDRGDHRRRRQAAAVTSSAPPTRSGAPLTVALSADGKRRHPLQVGARRRRPAVADARADRRQETSLSAQPGPGDREPQLDPDPGQPPASARPGKRHRVTAPEPLTAGDVRRTARRDGEPTGEGRRDLSLQDGQAGRALSDRDRGRRPRVPRARAAHRRVDRAGHARPRRRRAGRHREDGRGRREALRTLSLGPLRRDRPAAVLPLRRDGKSDPHLPDADLHCRRQEPRRPGRA